MVECEETEETSNSSIGIILVLIACVCYASGNCLQRYALLRQPGELVFGCLNRHVGWMLGAFIYFSANGIYSVAVSFAPITLLAAVFSLTIVVNAACSVYFLGDQIPRIAYVGYFFVLLGAVIYTVSFRAEVCHYGGEELVEVLLSPLAIAYWVCALLIAIGGYYFAHKFEKKYPLMNEEEDDKNNTIQPHSAGTIVNVDDFGTDPLETNNTKTQPHSAGTIVDVDDFGTDPLETNNTKTEITDNLPPPNINLLARVIYPATLGMIETIGQLILKAINSLLTTSVFSDDDKDSDNTTSSQSILAADEDFPNDIGLWIALVIFGGIALIGIIKFLRLVYARFEITGAFPIEFGILTFSSVIGGFVVYRDYTYVTDSLTWCYIALASVSILGGISIVAYGSWEARQHNTPGRQQQPKQQQSEQQQHGHESFSARNHESFSAQNHESFSA